MSPTPFGKYLLDEEIARGGMSRVFLARLRGLGGFEKRLVVKQVLPELASDPRFVSMFVNEAKIVVQMSHPNIAPVYELGVVDGVYFLAMEYIEGATLSQMLKSGGPLTPELVAHLGIEVCDALHYAHRRFGVVHRDVTPRNVIVDDAGHCRLLDFGIAAPADDDASALFGTPGYISPEQLSGGAVAPEADVFSLGAVLFEALTHRRAYGGQTLEEARKRLEGEAPSFEGIPAELADIVERALAREVAARFSSAEALGRALRGWLAGRAPEGVGPELGARARKTEPNSPTASTSGSAPETPGNDVQTLATSPLLDELLTGGTTPSTAALADRPGRLSDPPDTPSTAAIARRPSPAPKLDPPQFDPPQSDPPQLDPLAIQDRSKTAPRTAAAPGIRARWGLLLGLVAAAVGGWALYPAAPRPVDPPPRAPVVSLDAGLVDSGPPDAGADGGHDAGLDAGAQQDASAQAAAPAASRASLTVNAIPWGEVFVDGRAMGTTPRRGLPLRAGRHSVQVRCPPLGREVRTTVVLEAGERGTVVADLSRNPPTIRQR